MNARSSSHHVALVLLLMAYDGARAFMPAPTSFVPSASPLKIFGQHASFKTNATPFLGTAGEVQIYSGYFQAWNVYTYIEGDSGEVNRRWWTRHMECRLLLLFLAPALTRGRPTVLPREYMPKTRRFFILAMRPGKLRGAMPRSCSWE